MWELILSDSEFEYLDYNHQIMTIQDCWRSKERLEEQKAVRELLYKMNIDVVELPDNCDKTEFCGNSLYRAAPTRNLKLAPKRFVENAKGKFEEHSLEEQKTIMEEYGQRFHTEKVVTYCNYCQEGLELGGADSIHLASLLFKK